MRRAIVLQHISCQPPGLFAEVLNERGVTLDAVELDGGGVAGVARATWSSSWVVRWA